MTEKEKIEAIAALTAVIALFKELPSELAQPTLIYAKEKLNEVIHTLYSEE